MDMKSTKQEYFESLALPVPGELEFFGAKAAELFTEEVKQSLRGVLEKSFAYTKGKPQENFVTTSVDGRVCSDHLWSRDAGTLMRELVQWGYMGHACYLADILLTLADKNEEGYYTFPMYFLKGRKEAGSELDGTGAVVISFVLLWKRLENEHPIKKRIHDFITGGSSPVWYILRKLEKAPLIAGSGEFGGGMGVEGEYCNVVQNYLVHLMLKAVESMMRICGNSSLADLCAGKAASILTNMEGHMVDEEGAWIWCIDPVTMKADPDVLNYETNKGFGGINGVIAMYADVHGFELPREDWKGAEASIKSFDRLLATKLRKEQYEKYGMWTQFDVLISGLLTSPSYGQGYALQASILFDRLTMVDRLVGYLAEATFQPPEGYKLDRDTKYHFYERMLSPDFTGIREFDQGCGALNLVNVAEPLKAARMLAGIDDTSDCQVKIIPRIPPSWSGFSATDWPILADGKIVRGNIRFLRKESGCMFSLELNAGDIIPDLEVRLPGQNGGFSRHTFHDVSKIELMLK